MILIVTSSEILVGRSQGIAKCATYRVGLYGKGNVIENVSSTEDGRGTLPLPKPQKELELTARKDDETLPTVCVGWPLVRRAECCTGWNLSLFSCK